MNKLLILAAALAAALSIPAASALSTNGLVAYWPFDEANGEAVLDGSGHGHHGVLGSSASDTLNNPLRVPGHASPGALSVERHEWVTLGPSPDFNPEHLTISFWMQSTQTAGYNVLARFHEPNCYAESFALYGQDGFLRLYVQLPDNTFVQSGTVPNTNWLYDGAWHHIAATFDGYEAKLYVDAMLVTEGASAPLGMDTPMAALSGNEPIEAGNGASCDALGLDTGFHGTIDELTLWKRPLDPIEISQLAGSTTPPLPEWPAVMLVGAGLAVLLLVAHRRKMN